MAQCKVTIEMPEEWFDSFWGWFIDGGGEDEFMGTLDDQVPGWQKDGFFSNWLEDKKLITFGRNETDVAID